MARTGLKVSEICLGTMTFGMQCDEPTSFSIMDEAVGHGVDFFDTAMAIRWAGPLKRSAQLRRSSASGSRDVAIRSCWRPSAGCNERAQNDRGLSRKHIFEASKQACAACRRIISISTKHMHPTPTHPSTRRFVPTTICRQGKVRYLGCSNFKAWQLATAL